MTGVRKADAQFSDELTRLRQRVAELERIGDEHRAAEEELRYRLKFEGLITSISTRFVDLATNEVDTAINHALRAIGEFVGVDRVHLFQSCDGGTMTANTHEWCAEGIAPRMHRLQRFSLDGFPWAAERMKRADVVHVPRVADLPPEAAAEREGLANENIQSLLLVPMTYAGSVTGAVALGSVRVEKTWPADVIALLRIVGETFANALARERSEAALRESEERFRNVLEVSGDVIYKLDLETGAYDYISPSAARLLGFTPDEMIAMGLAGVRRRYHPDDNEQYDRHFEDLVRHTVEGTTVPRVRYRWRHKDGEYRWYSASRSLVRDERGRPKAIVGSIRDISERKQAEEALRLYGKVVESSPDLIAAVDTEYKYLFVNRAFLEYHGLEREEVVGRTVAEILGREAFDAAVKQYVDRSLAGETVQYEMTYRYPKKGERDFLVSYFPLRGETGRVIGVAAVIQDTTERKLLEERLRQAHKMEAIGQLAGGIAHDFNNLLTGILGYANILKLEAEPGSDVHDAAKTIERAAERAAELTSKLLGFARQGKHQVVPVDLHGTLHEVVALLGRTLDKNIRITLDLRAPGSTVMGDPGQLQHVFLNLAVNARDAMPGGGELVIESKAVELDAAYCQAHPGLTPGRHLRIAVTDTGCGIPRDVQGRIFEPFFTTKKPGEGTGMGLAMAYGIVKNHKGSIHVESEEGRGTTFRVYLRLVSDAQVTAAGRKHGEPVRGTGRILVVDDEEVVRSVAARALRALGYDVVTAPDGKQAVDIYREQQGAIDVVIIDMVMPEMGGRDCFRALRELDPHVKAVLSSGYGRDGKAQGALDDGMLGFVQKPYRMQELSEAVAAALRR